MELVINLIANIFIVIGMTFFIIGVFGRKSQVIDSLHPIEGLLLKVSLCAVASGALFNILSSSVPPPSEIFLNAGLGLLFVWAAWFHWKYFVKKK